MEATGRPGRHADDELLVDLPTRKAIIAPQLKTGNPRSRAVTCPRFSRSAAGKWRTSRGEIRKRARSVSGGSVDDGGSGPICTTHCGFISWTAVSVRDRRGLATRVLECNRRGERHRISQPAETSRIMTNGIIGIRSIAR